MQPWLSIVVPTYNGAAYVRQALDSVEAQRDDAIEIIAIDDGSTDETVAILRAYARRLPMTVIERPHRGNWVQTTNEGMAAARGKYFGLLHQDDVWLPERLQVLRALVARWPRAELFVHPCWYLNSIGRRIGYWRCPLPRVGRPLAAIEVLEHLLVQCFIAVPAPVFRAESADAVGRLDERLWYSADWDLWLKLAALGITVYHASPLASFRVHARSQTLQLAGRGDELHRQQAVVLARHLPLWEALCPGRPDIAEVAHYSAQVNAALADWAGGRPLRVRRLAAGLIGLGPAGWRRYVRDSQIIERCASRLHLCGVRDPFAFLDANRAPMAAPCGPAAAAAGGLPDTC
jgi:GT2 family glycosyltransferase